MSGKHKQLLKNIAKTPGDYRHILFLCYGNICRSPLAALLAQKAIPERVIVSAGFHNKADRCSPLHMLNAATEAGIDMRAHRSQTATAEAIEAADLVLVMDWKNYDQLLEQFPGASRKTTFLGLFANPGEIEIEDPYDLHGVRLSAVVNRIRSAVDGLKRQLTIGKRFR